MVAQAQQEVPALVVANGGAGDDLTVSSSNTHTLTDLLCRISTLGVGATRNGQMILIFFKTEPIMNLMVKY